MPTQKYAVNQHLIEHLLSWVDTGEIAIPEIQRPFVWTATKVRDLLDSLYQGFPVGYIIVWKNPNIRPKDGSLSEGKKVLIDGQQRVTALTAALMGQVVMTKEYKQVRIVIAFNPQTERFEVSNPAIQRNRAWVPDIAPLMKGELSLLKLIRQYSTANPEVSEDELERVFTQLTGIGKKQIGVIELAADLDIEMVSEIFIRINGEGVPLSQADFAMSKIAANESYGGNVLRKAIDYFCHLAVAPEFYANIAENDETFAKTAYFKTMRWLRNENDDLYDPSYSDMLRVAYTSRFSRGRLADLVGLLSGRNFEERSYEESIAEASFQRLSDGVMDFMNETNFKRFVMIIKDAGFIDSGLLRAQAPVNFAYALLLKLRTDKYPAADIERFVRRWFVLSMLTGRYSSSMETRFDEDFRHIDEHGFGKYLADIEAAELSDTFWSVGLPQALTTSNSNHPAFKTFLASQAKSAARGFLSRDITVRSMLEHRGDVHHIFPKNYLKKAFKLTPSRYNQVANYAYTQQEINIAIGDRRPEEYMSAIREQCDGQGLRYGSIDDEAVLRRNLDENALPQAFLDGTLYDYDEFLAERRMCMSAAIRKYYEAL